MRIIAVDFDGTLSRGDSTKLFFNYISESKSRFLWNYYLRFSLYFTLYFISGNFIYLKRRRIAWVGEKLPHCNLDDFTKVLLNQLNENVVSEIRSRHEDGVKVVVVSAGIRELIHGACHELGYELIAKGVAACSDKELLGGEKVSRLYSEYPGCSLLCGFGNSQGDVEMLRHSDNPYWVDTLGNIKNIKGNV